MKLKLRIGARLRNVIADPDIKLIFVVFLPIFIDMILNHVISTVHSYFVASIGDNAISAIGLAGQVNGLFCIFFMSLTTAITVIVSQYNGAGELDNARKCVSQTIFAILVISGVIGLILFLFPHECFRLFFGKADIEIENMAVTYMKCIAASLPFYGNFMSFCCASRGFGNNKIPLVISVSGSIINLACAFIFIKVFSLGVMGAGLGYIFSRLVSTVIGYVIFAKQKWLSSLKDAIRLNFKLLGSVISLGFMISSESLIVSVGSTVKTNFLVPFGAAHLAARSIDGTFQSLCLVPVSVMSTVAVTLVGRYIGSGDKDEAKLILKKTIGCTYLLYGVTMIAALFISPVLFKGYTQSDETLRLLRILLYIDTGFSTLIMPFLNVMLSGFKAAGDAKFSTVISICCMWAVNVGVGYILVAVMNLGIIGFTLSAFLSALAKAIIIFIRYRSGKWIHKRLV